MLFKARGSDAINTGHAWTGAERKKAARAERMGDRLHTMQCCAARLKGRLWSSYADALLTPPPPPLHHLPALPSTPPCSPFPLDTSPIMVSIRSFTLVALAMAATSMAATVTFDCTSAYTWHLAHCTAHTDSHLP